MGEIVYVLPEELPAGWTVKIATERLGRPQHEWQDHTEVLTATGRGGYLILSAHRPNSILDTGTRFPPIEPGVIEDVDPSNFVYLFAYLFAHTRPTETPEPRPSDSASPSEPRARAVRWRANGFELFVAQVSSAPNDALIDRVADEFAQIDTLDFQMPASALAAGFRSVGGFPGSSDLTDYTVSWAPSELAGADREAAVKAPNEGPALWVNVGSRAYAQNATALSTDPTEAPIKSDSGLLKMDFLLDGILVSVGGREVREASLRAFATSLRPYSRDTWRARLGERLVGAEQQ